LNLEPAFGLFADAEAMKDKVRQSLLHGTKIVVSDYYWKTGLWQAIARNHIFEQVSLTIISFNAIWIAIETDYNKSSVLIEAEPIFQFAEQGFCLFFSLELFIRFKAFKDKRNCLRDRWFVFDSFLVLMMVLETWVLTLAVVIMEASSGDKESGGGAGSVSTGDASILRLFRLLRLSRMARVARLFRAVPELMVMIKGCAIALRSLAVLLFLLSVLIYVFAIAFTQLLTETPAGTDYFPSVTGSMSSLLAYGVFLDNTPEVMDALVAESIIYYALFIVFVLLSAFTVLNMYIGVMVETVRVVSEVESEEALVISSKEKILDMLRTSGLDEDGDHMISQSEFMALIQIPDAARALRELGVDCVALVDMADYIFESKAQLTFSEFMEVVYELRGSNHATVRDVVDLRKCMRQDIAKLIKGLETLVPAQVRQAKFKTKSRELKHTSSRVHSFR